MSITYPRPLAGGPRGGAPRGGGPRGGAPLPLIVCSRKYVD